MKSYKIKQESGVISMTYRTFLFFIFDIIFLSIPAVKVTSYLTIRVAACFFLILIAIRKRIFIFDKVIKCYFLYLILYIFANFINGEFFWNGEHIHILTNHFASIVLILSLPAIFKSEVNIRAAIYAFFLILMVTLVISHLQFIKNEFAWVIGSTLSNEKIAGTAEAIIDEGGDFIGTSVISGIFNSAVTNGYYIASFLPIVLSASLLKKKWNFVVVNLFFVMSIVVSYYLQQRACMLLVLLFIAYFYISQLNKGPILFFVIFGSIMLTMFLPDYLSGIEMGRFSDAGDTRTGLWYQFVDFTKNGNIIWGGSGAYREKYSDPQHNTFLSAWVLGGIFCFLIITYLIILLLAKLFKYTKSNDIVLKSSALCCIMYVLSSMLHSAGIQNNAVMFWMIYMLFLSREKFLRKNSMVLQHNKKVVL